jgi:chemotaxis protein methyltransferase WspC
VALSEVEKLLSARLGFDVHTIGRHAVAAVIKQSMEQAGCSDFASYARLLSANSGAWNDLVDRVVIPETWFFRDSEPFELAADLALAQIRSASGKVFRILSCPCSTGEEPYSLAIALLQAGAPVGSFLVDAVDVSLAALESARVAVFRTRSFREDDHFYRVTYFNQADGDGLWRLNRPVASIVTFRQGNLIAPDFLLEEAPYDLVFCRNLLIYLHPEARVLAMKALRRLLAEDAVLALGHAEAAFARENGFKQKGHAAAFAFTKPGVHDARKPHQASRRPPLVADPPRPPAIAPGTLSLPLAPAIPRVVAPVVPAPPEPERSQLTIARELGDAGRLHEALRVCGDYLDTVPDSAEGHFLSGVIHDALGHSELAVASFRKALYLDPVHREALLHLALKREAAGDGAGAALLRARAQRAPIVSAAE